MWKEKDKLNSLFLCKVISGNVYCNVNNIRKKNKENYHSIFLFMFLQGKKICKTKFILFIYLFIYVFFYNEDEMKLFMTNASMPQKFFH